MDGCSPRQCNDRHQASLLVETSLGEPLHEDIVHYAQLLQGSSTQGGKLREGSRCQMMSLATSQGARNKGEGRVVYEVLKLLVLLMGAQLNTKGALKHKTKQTIMTPTKTY